MAKSSSFVDRCRARGLRITGPRQRIADIVSSATDHPDVAEIHRRVALLDPSISLSTVYRTLKLFADLGLIESHSFDGGRSRVERATGEHHDHLIDVATGSVIEFHSLEIERLQTEIARNLGYELTGHRLELYGRKIR